MNDRKDLTVSVIVPAYNEAPTLGEVFARLASRHELNEILIVDDGSCDETAVIAENAARKDRRFRMLRHEKNLGKGAAVATALAVATSDVIIIQDADLEYDPNDFPRLLAPIRDGRAQVVYGSRLRGSNPVSYLSFFLGGILLSFLTDLLFAARITDEPTCYKVFKRECLRGITLQARGFEFCPELTAKLLLAGYRIHEVPISYTPRLKEQGKKISWVDGIKAIHTLVTLRLTGRLR